MAVSEVSGNPAPKVESPTKNTSKETQAKDYEKAKARVKEESARHAEQQLAEIGTNVNIAV